MAAFPSSKAQIKVDDYDRAVTITDIEHKIHKGEMFRANAVFSLGVGAEKLALFRTGNVQAHVYGEVTASGDSYMRFYESPTVTADGTPVTFLNKNRAYDTSGTSVTVFDTPTISSNGTLLDPFVMSGSINAGGKERQDNEWTLKVNTDYLILIHANAASDYTLKIDWYEEVV